MANEWRHGAAANAMAAEVVDFNAARRLRMGSMVALVFCKVLAMPCTQQLVGELLHNACWFRYVATIDFA
jgi:hypothetical protein